MLGYIGESPGEAAYNRAQAANEEPLPEIVVTAKKVPWWQWMLGGVAALLVVQLALKKD